MRRLEVRFRPEAVADLDEIYEHIHRLSFSVETAFGLIDRIRDRCRRIGDAPHAGRPRDDLEPACGRYRSKERRSSPIARMRRA